MLRQRVGTFLGAFAGLAIAASPAQAQWSPMPVPNNGGGAFWDNPSDDGGMCNVGFILTATNGSCGGQRPANWLPYEGPAPMFYLGNGGPIGFTFAAGSYNIKQLGSMSLGGDLATANAKWGVFSNGIDIEIPGSGSGSADINQTMYFADSWGIWIDLARPNTGERAYSNSLASDGRIHAALFSQTTTPGLYDELIIGLEDNACQGVDLQVQCSKATDADYQDVILSVTAVPEPSTYALMAVGLLAVGVASRRRKSVNA